jgi:hypothetical protein
MPVIAGINNIKEAEPAAKEAKFFAISPTPPPAKNRSLKFLVRSMATDPAAFIAPAAKYKASPNSFTLRTNSEGDLETSPSSLKAIKYVVRLIMAPIANLIAKVTGVREVAKFPSVTMSEERVLLVTPKAMAPVSTIATIFARTGPRAKKTPLNITNPFTRAPKTPSNFMMRSPTKTKILPSPVNAL